MKSILLAATALFGITAMSAGAFAADEGGSYDWSGFYLGLNGGGIMDNSSVSTSASGTAAWTNTGKEETNSGDPGFTGGGLMGYNWQLNHAVLGIETDLNFGGMSGDGSTAFGSTAPITGTSVNYETTWYGTLRGRAGYAFDNVLLYGTVGLAYGDFNTESYIGQKKVASSDWVGIGWTAGAGVEYGIENWSLGVEYLYVDLGSQSYSATEANYKVEDNVDNRFSVVRVTLKYSF